MDTLLIALLVAVIGPVLLSWMNGRQRRKEKVEDYKRQDAVADRLLARQDAVADKADAVADQAAEAARLLLAENKRVAASSGAALGKLDVIHSLVNSSMTSAMQSELDATIRELALMREVIDLKRAASGKEPTEDALVAERATAVKIDELRAALDDRGKQTEAHGKEGE